MSLLWHYYWPVFALGLLIGTLTGIFLYNRIVIGARDRLAGLETAIDDKQRKRKLIFYAGLGGTLALAASWHGPLGAGDRFAGRVEAAARAELERQEMLGVSARLERSPLRRRIVLSGPADDFQQGALVRILDEMPGVSGVRWASPPAVSTESAK
ncbi:MAG: hypothetical protein H0V46_01830 [Sphingomonas sp.]|nr:hypothetical protein [Sphingomonas sp.]